MDAGIDEDETVGGQIEGNGLQLFPAAAAEAGGIEDKEGAIAPQLCGVVEEAGGIEAEMELPVESQEGEGTVGGAATEAGADRNILIEMDVDVGQGREIGFQQLVGLLANVPVAVAGDREAVGGESGSR